MHTLLCMHENRASLAPQKFQRIRQRRSEGVYYCYGTVLSSKKKSQGENFYGCCNNSSNNLRQMRVSVCFCLRRIHAK